MKRKRMWGVFRDGKPYLVFINKQHAAFRVMCFKPGSKHKWRVQPLNVSWSSPKRRKKKDKRT